MGQSRSFLPLAYLPPLLGQHTTAVLHEVLGYDQTKIDQLIADGAIEQAE